MQPLRGAAACVAGSPTAKTVNQLIGGWWASHIAISRTGNQSQAPKIPGREDRFLPSILLRFVGRNQSEYRLKFIKNSDAHGPSPSMGCVICLMFFPSTCRMSARARFRHFLKTLNTRRRFTNVCNPSKVHMCPSSIDSAGA